MARTITELMEANLHGVFGERDDAKRLAVASEIYAEGVTFFDPVGAVTGRDAVEAKARNLLAGAPGFVFTAHGSARVSGDLGLLAWGFGPDGAPPVATGTDIAIVVDGRIARLHTLLDETPA